MKTVFSLMLVLFLAGFLHGQQPAAKQWVLTRDDISTMNLPNGIVASSVTLTGSFGNCHVYIQKNGEIRVDALEPVYKGFREGLWEKVTLSAHRDRVLETLKVWDPVHRWDGYQLVEDHFRAPDLVGKYCWQQLKFAPRELRAPFKGYHGIPPS